MWPRRSTIPGGDGSPKIHRYYLAGSGKTLGVFLHHFVASDDGNDVHDHPWRWGVGVVLRGGYFETRRQTNGELRERWVGPGRHNLLSGDDFHFVRLKHDRAAWTLFFHGPVIKRWGFIDLATGIYRMWKASN